MGWLLEEQGLGKPLQKPLSDLRPVGRFTPGLLFEEKKLKAESLPWSLWLPVVWLLEEKPSDLPRDVEDWNKAWRRSLHRRRIFLLGMRSLGVRWQRTEAGQEWVTWACLLLWI